MLLPGYLTSEHQFPHEENDDNYYVRIKWDNICKVPIMDQHKLGT